MADSTDVISVEAISVASSSVSRAQEDECKGPFSGLVICVTGLSKEARKQVMEETRRLGGHYSPHLHSRCTHLIVKSTHGPKFEHAMKYGSEHGLFIVPLAWFVGCVKKDVRLSESKFIFKNHSLALHFTRSKHIAEGRNTDISSHAFIEGRSEHYNKFDAHQSFLESYKKSSLYNSLIYTDSQISAEMQQKIRDAAIKEGACFLDEWFVGCGANHVICESSRIGRYLGHSQSIVSPLWVLKTEKEKKEQRLVHVSVDLARQVGLLLESHQVGGARKDVTNGSMLCVRLNDECRATTLDEREEIVKCAKDGVRGRRHKYPNQVHRIPVPPTAPKTLLESICWSISDPPSTASIYVSGVEGAELEGARGSEESFSNLTRKLRESDKCEVILKNHFLSILFPVDRYSEMAPTSMTYFSSNGFTCIEVLERIYDFYQGNMSHSEIEASIHTDSRQEDRLRSVYASKESETSANFKRVGFMGSRLSFEMLRRVNFENNCSLYELLIRA